VAENLSSQNRLPLKRASRSLATTFAQKFETMVLLERERQLKPFKSSLKGNLAY